MTAKTKVDMNKRPKKFLQFMKLIKSQAQLELLLSAACVTPEYLEDLRRDRLTHNRSSSSIDSIEAVDTSYSCSSIRTFTFVMDPFQRLVKGFSESVWRYHFATSRQKDQNMIFKTLNTTIVKEKLIDLFAFRNPKLAGIQTLYPMAGSLFAYSLDLIGHLDNFIVDWEEVIAPQYGLTKQAGYAYEYSSNQKYLPSDPDYLKKRGQVNVTHGLLISQGADVSNARNTLSALFESEPAYARAICHLLLVDYVCLPSYPLPEQCAFLSKTRAAAEKALSSSNEIDPVVIV